MSDKVDDIVEVGWVDRLELLTYHYDVNVIPFIDEWISEKRTKQFLSIVFNI